jgi:glycosidase
MTEQSTHHSLPCEFHIAGSVRTKYRFDKNLFRSNGNVIFADFRAVREFAKNMNEGRAPGDKPVRAGELNAMGLIDEFMHLVFRTYEESINPGFLRKAIGSLEESMGAAKFRSTLHAFTEQFPPLAVYAGESTAASYLAGTTGGRPHPEVTLEECLMLHLANLNPAFVPFRELFDDRALSAETSYDNLMSGLREMLRQAPPVRGEGESAGKGESILDVLEAPFRAHPGSLSAQMLFIRERWAKYLPKGFDGKILSAEDLAREDSKEYPTGGTGPVLPPDYSDIARGLRPGYPETENFTHDTDWMPNVVLLAKNSYVWLDQLSKRYGRTISRLDQVPDEELDRIAGWNFTSLWLIGIWSRSPASEKIKKMSGNPEAAPSAYSVFEYEIAPDLGGEEAFGNLSHRAWQRGIRLAADMVPNHTGLTSRWMRERPDFFIQSERPPFPAYRFTGENLSDDPDYQVRIEDGYWSKTDAAVVFQRVDNRDGRVRYIYHGNDGTNMPWNDTAQLDFLKSEVREAVIGQILHVARKFSVIRFDAAMTLAKKHFHRLWYPQPGTGGDIPSRADHALWQEDFDAMFPVEFWRQVVDRINTEMPQTLLLAEAFWLLEGYFVRTLGMHRVYNSAFMHILLKEDNAMYREAIRNTLHFEPEILKRYVNFMSNPDEKTAVDQFGKGDKYFAIATLMVTLPGLPMFAHGQIEGFGEKYGMEYRRAYRDEVPDADLVRRHEREIMPLLRLRHLFSQTADFELYDVVDRHGTVIQDVFAYSNMARHSGIQRSIVCVNNRYESYAGRIHVSAGKLGDGGIGYRTLGEALGMMRENGLYYIFTEHRSGLEFIRPATEFLNDGMPVVLGAFQSQVFLDFREVRDADGIWERLCRELEGRGVPDIARAGRAIPLRPFHEAFVRLLEPSLIGSVTGGSAEEPAWNPAGLKEFRKRFAAASAALEGVATAGAGRRKERELRLDGWLKRLPKLFSTDGTPGPIDAAAFLGWLSASALVPEGVARGGTLREGFEELLLDMPLEQAFTKLSNDGPAGRRKALLVESLVMSWRRLGTAGDNPRRAFREIVAAPGTREFLGVNLYQGVEYFNRESFWEIASYWELQARLAAGSPPAKKPAGRGAATGKKPLPGTGSIHRDLLGAAESSGFRMDALSRYLDSPEFLTLPGTSVTPVKKPAQRAAASRPAGKPARRGTLKKKT